MTNLEPMADIACEVNGMKVEQRVPVRRSLVDWLRHDLGLTGSHVGCEQGVCGACHVVVGGRVVRGCLMLAVQADGQSIETIDKADPSRTVRALQEAFYVRAALQCGYCTPGMILQAAELLASNPGPTRADVREALSGNYCRCTGYHAIVDAVQEASRRLSGEISNEGEQTRPR
jgi:aerobic-type carbon monoxide dehydrogenase small subunit (CoxS/CutS family)